MGARRGRLPSPMGFGPPTGRPAASCRAAREDAARPPQACDRRDHLVSTRGGAVPGGVSLGDTPLVVCLFVCFFHLIINPGDLAFHNVRAQRLACDSPADVATSPQGPDQACPTPTALRVSPDGPLSSARGRCLPGASGSRPVSFSILSIPQFALPQAFTEHIRGA